MGFFDIFKFGQDKRDGGFRQDWFSGKKGSSKKEHTWSKTSGSGKQYKEGWHGKNFKGKK